MSGVVRSPSRRRFVRGSLALAGLGLLTACLPAPAAPTTRAERAAGAGERGVVRQPTPEPTTISWSFWGDSWQTEVTRRVARAFEAEQPTIRVEPRHREWAEYFTWLGERWQQGDAADVMFLNYIPARAPSGQLEPLNPYFARDRVDLSDFYPRLLEQFQVGGTYYGLPRDNDTKVIYYNKRLLAEARVEPPSDGWTWDDLRRLARAVAQHDTGGPSAYGFAFEAETWWQLFVWQNGGDLVDDPFHPTRVRLGEPAALEAIQFLADLIHVERCTPPAEVLLSTERIRKLFRDGRLALALGNHALVPAFVEQPGLDWDVVGLPVARERANMAGGAGYTIWAGSQHKEAAWKLLQFLTGPKGQSLFAESGVIVAARRSIREDNIFLRQQPYNARVWGEETNFGRPTLNAPIREAVVQIVEPALARVWRGERSAAEAVNGVLPELRRLVE